MRKNSYLTVTDQFCGAGGSSQGVRMAAEEMKIGNGIEVKLAMNHWKLAIETHNTNFPDTDHVCTDISACDPRRYPSTDILITSPECTVHSPAGGGQAKKKKFGNQMHTSGKFTYEVEEERSRITMWDVPRFAEYHKYNIVIVENVIEARSKWILFDNWLMAMDTLGYNHEVKYINSMHAFPTPQSRDRMYCIFWKKGNKKPDLNFTPTAFCHHCATNVLALQWWKPGANNNSKTLKEHGKYKTQYLFKCPTCSHIVEPYFYAAFNCIDWSKPGTRIGDRKKPLSDKTTERCQYGIDKFWDEPSFINVKFSSGVDFRVKSVADDALTTQPGDAAVGLLNPLVISSRYIQGIGNRVKSSTTQPLPVQVTDGRESILNPPVIVSRQGKTHRSRSSKDALPTQLGSSHDHVMTPPLVIDGGWHESKRIDNAIKDPLSTQDTGQTKGLVLPFIIKNFSGEPQAFETDKTLGAITTQDHHGLVNQPLMIELNRTGKARPADQSMSTVTAGGVKHGLLTPLMVENKGQSKSKPSLEPTASQTTKPSNGIITADQFNSFLAYYNGGSKMASHITEPTGTIATGDRIAMIKQPYTKPRLEDCFYRMLLPHEIQLGMAFAPDYIVLGDSKQKVKQLGNAVTPPVMKWIIQRCIQSLS